MARNDGVDRVTARNVNLADTKTANVQRHNEREKESYVNSDIVTEMTPFNVHYKKPNDTYENIFNKMVEDKIISTRGLKADAKKYGELIFDVNSAYFFNRGGYEFAKKFYEDAQCSTNNYLSWHLCFGEKCRSISLLVKLRNLDIVSDCVALFHSLYWIVII